MDYLNISEFNLYKTFKKAPYSVESALIELIQNSINNFKKNNDLNEKSIILIYWDLDNKKIQIMDNSKGIDQNTELSNLWYCFDNNKAYNHHLISSSFFLGNSVTIESKNGTKAFATTLDLVGDVTKNVKIDFYENNEVLRIFNTGTRITITNLNHKIVLDQVNEIYNILSFVFHKIIDETNCSIIFSVIDNGIFIDPSFNEIKHSNNIANVNRLHFKLPELNHTKTIYYQNEILDQENNLISYEFNAYQFLISKEMPGISFSNNQRIILEANRLFRPDWYDSSFASIYVDLKINNLPLDLFNSRIMLDELTKKKIVEVIKEKIQPLKTTFPRDFTRPLIDPPILKTKTLPLSNQQNEDKLLNNSDSLNDSKEYLTKIFNQTGKLGSIDDFEIIKDKLHFTYNADDGKKIRMKLIKSKDNKKSEWLQVIPISENNVDQEYEYDLKINLNHPYFKEFLSNSEILHKLEHFIVCYAIAECITRLDGSSVNQLKYEINKLLWGNENDFS